MARNAAIDKLRTRKAGTVDIDEVFDLSDGSLTPEAEAIASSERALLHGCLEELEADRYDAVRRAYLDGDSYKELTARYDVPLNTMRTWLRRSLIKLKECLSRRARGIRGAVDAGACVARFGPGLGKATCQIC